MEFIQNAIFAYEVYWRAPVGVLYSYHSENWSWLLADLSFVWISVFISVNIMHLIFDKETMWGRFQGNDTPFPALIRISFYFAFLPILIMAGFVTSKWEAQDAGVSILASWVVFLVSLASLANI